ncbi:uncharacterized protein LOC105387093 isoform X3 [Plutella xylostella]|uniref:uncharacterized protein LOC105387093 isoform X3 n=1 Tax=Plutella xylostella TaxID=51655 RepID=UPI002033171D|nr:uncharacterized protein LOC105387093 isoform X3 [Plutella xylostella]
MFNSGPPVSRAVVMPKKHLSRLLPGRRFRAQRAEPAAAAAAADEPQPGPSRPRARTPTPPPRAAPSRADSDSDDEAVATCCGAIAAPREQKPDINEVDTWPIDAPFCPDEDYIMEWLRLGYRERPRAERQALELVEHLLRRAHNGAGPAFLCASCLGVLRRPVTGACGHSRCRACTLARRCPCGEPTTAAAAGAPAPDVLAQRLLSTLTVPELFARMVMNLSEVRDYDEYLMRAQRLTGPPHEGVIGGSHLCFTTDSYVFRLYARMLLPPVFGPVHRHVRFSRRYIYARELARRGRLAKVSRLARGAARGYKAIKRRAKKMLLQCCLRQVVNNSTLLADLWAHAHAKYAATVLETSKRWIKAGELDCILCCSHYRSGRCCLGHPRCPVTTPCGHTYCRSCLERSLDYRPHCPLCSQSLLDFNVDATNDNLFVVQAIQSGGLCAIELPDCDDRLPIFVCTVAFPTVPCPLYVFEPRYRLMIRRCMRKRNKVFGMVSCDATNTFSDYGTILEIRDCVRLSDGRSILSTIGLSRFRILERGIKDGYDVARVERIIDVRPSPTLYRAFSRQLRDKAARWLRHMDRGAQLEIEATFGAMPPEEDPATQGPDGPAWLWWILAILPLASDLKVMILSTPLLEKRLMAVERTLDVMSHSWRPVPRTLNLPPMLQRAA